MCLKTVDRKIKQRKSNVGYKVMIKCKDAYLSEYTYGAFKKYELGRTYTDRKRKPIDAVYFRYPTGYHIFTSLQSARKWHCSGVPAIVKVEYHRVVATGKQFNGNVVIARKMKLLEEIKENG